MTKNDIIKLTCTALNIDQNALLAIFRLSDPQVAPQDVADLMKNETEEGFIFCSDEGLGLFLDGLIISRRGPGSPQKKPAPKASHISNNTVLKKLRIALELQDDAMLELFKLGGVVFSRSELTPYFRKEGHRNYKRCNDKMLRIFLKGLSLSDNY